MTTVDGHGGEMRLEPSVRSFSQLLLQVGESLHATLVVDEQGRIGHIDGELAVAVGWGNGVPPEGRPLEEVLLLLPWLVEALHTALTGTETVREGGERDRWVRALVLPVFGHEGQCLGACARLSERAPVEPESVYHAALEQELTRTQRQYEELLDTIDGIVWEADVNFRFTFVNRQSERLLGHPPRQWLQEPDFWKNHVHPEDREWAHAYCLKASRERRPYELEYRMLAADGRVVWLRTMVTVLAEEGRPLKLRGIMVDVTEQRHAREKLEQTASLLRATFDSIADGVIVVDRHLRVTAFNQRFQQLLQLPDDVLVGRPDVHETLMAALPLARDPERFAERLHELYATPELKAVDLIELRDGRTLERTTRPQWMGHTIIGRICSYRDVTAEHQAREKLELTVSLLRATFDSITDGVLVVSRDQRITAFNKRFQQLWGYSDEDLRGTPDPKQTLPAAIAQVKEPERFLAWIQEMYAAPEREGIDIIEFRNGTILQRTTIPQRLGSTIIGRIWSYRDVTEERRARAKLEQTVSLLRTTFDSIADGVVVVDRNQRITATNKRFQQLWGLPAQVLLENLHAMQAVRAAAPLVKDPEGFVAGLREMFVLSDLEHVDTVELRDGRILERTTMPQRLGSTIIGRIWSYRDVTEERLAKAEQERLLVAEQHAREQLEESLAVLDTFLNNAPIGLGFLDRELRFLQVNDALAALHGKTREEELGQTLRALAPTIAANVEPLIRQVLETGEPIIGLDLTLEVPATPGQLRHWRVSYYPVRTASGRMVGVGVVVVELTEERHAQEERERLLLEAREAIQLRDDFLCVASHELKTPLTPLTLHLQRLKKLCASGQPPPPLYAEKALAQVERLSGLISDMLDSSQIDAGRLELEREPLTLQEVVRQALADFRPACLHHPLEYAECAEALPVLGDRKRLTQVLMNLLENARKYSPLKGPIRVTLTRDGSEARVSVSDSGIGIPEDQQAQLFERFFRARNAPVSGFGGLGLGLYISRYLVERHDGRIWAESRNNQGTTFHFTLPLRLPGHA